MVTCWASELGGCDRQSREHYVTAGLWSSSKITISGFDWQDGERKLLPVPTLETKTLCKFHNEGLSKIDAEAIRIFKFIGEGLDKVKSGPPQKKSLLPERYLADGPLFERWCAKTVVDFICVEPGDKVWHDTGSPIINPPMEIVRCIFGRSRFQAPMGLYLAQETTAIPQEVLREEVSVDTLFHPSTNGFMGAFLSFRDYRFLIWLSREPIEAFSAITRSGMDFIGAESTALYHPSQLKIQVNYVVRHKVVFRW